ncbi:ATP-binding protein [Neobacillus sp. D3-1R]|uniref:ATP-binding protein n=1 Tax=Neobacillus sp. D3-1R TaxID=3445778 RepID=UPI003F9EFA27
MISGASNLILNLLIILSTLTIHQLWIESKPNNTFIKKYSVFITSGLAILLCMVFSEYQEKRIHFDLRRIPLWFGTLYGGPIVGLLLSFETIFIRQVQGGNGVFGTVLTTFLLYFCSVFIREFYFKLAKLKKVLLSAGINFLFSLLVLWIISKIANQSIDSNVLIEYVTINLLGIILVSFSIEAISKNYFIRMKIFESVRLETVSHLAASVNHEIKNPLTTVRGVVQFLKDDDSLPIDTKQDFYQLVLDETDKINRVVSDYLTFASPYPDSLQEIHVNKLINEALNIIRPLADQGSIIIKDELLDNGYVKGNHSKFVQTLVNILQNSIDALPNGGEIVINSYLKNNECLIHIKDNGIGMSKEIMDRLGEPFFTMDSNGTGLGMMVVFKVIEQMNGQIYINSQEGIGTVIVLSIPSIME